MRAIVSYSAPVGSGWILGSVVVMSYRMLHMNVCQFTSLNHKEYQLYVCIIMS